jgi:hypothetical protein
VDDEAVRAGGVRDAERLKARERRERVGGVGEAYDL